MSDEEVIAHLISREPGPAGAISCMYAVAWPTLAGGWDYDLFGGEAGDAARRFAGRLPDARVYFRGLAQWKRTAGSR